MALDTQGEAAGNPLFVGDGLIPILEAARVATEAGLFCELMDDPLLSEIEVETVLEYARRLAKLPSDIYQSRRKFGVERLADLMTVAELQGLPLKGETTVKGHVGRLSEIFNFGKTKGMLHFNPASDFKRGRGKTGRRDQDDRDVFTPEELDRIFSQAWFAEGTGKFSNKSRTKWRPHYYWLPLLALHTGGRLNELSQLYLKDVVQAKDDPSVWYIDFNLVGEGKNDFDGADKSLKTVNAMRVVPLHDSIIALGLPEYVAALRKAGYTRLFAPQGGNEAGEWAIEKVLSGGHVRERRRYVISHRHRAP